MQKTQPKLNSSQKNNLNSYRSTNLHSQRVEMEYNVQHQCWQKLRQRMKSMQLNKIDVTTYLNKNKDNNNSYNKNNQQQSIGLCKLNQKVFMRSQRKNKDKDEYDFIGNRSINSKQEFQCQVNLNNYVSYGKVYSSRDNQKIQNKSKIIYTPYLSNYRKLQKLRPFTHQQRVKKIDQQPSQNPQSSQNIQLSQQKNVNHPIVQNSSQILKIRQKRLSKQKSRTKTTATHYKKNIIQDLTKQASELKKSNKYGKDLIQFSKLQDKDYVQRVIVRRKSNIVADYFQAIQAAILKGKILLLTVDVTAGDISFMKDIGAKTPSAQKAHQKSLKLQNNERKINPTGSKQAKLLIGSCQILQYLQLLCLSHHPLELQNSITILAVILVDFIKVTQTGLKIDKTQFNNYIKNVSPDHKSFNIQQAYKGQQQNKLIRWKTPHRQRKLHKSQKLSHQTNIIAHNFNNQRLAHQNKHKQLQKQVQYFHVYGHPKPIINGEQIQLLANQQVDQQWDDISASMAKKDIKNQRQNDKNLQKQEKNKTQQKIIFQNLQSLEQKLPAQNIKLGEIEQNTSKIIQQQKINQNVVNIQTISINEQVINNQSKVLSKNESIADNVIIQ